MPHFTAAVHISFVAEWTFDACADRCDDRHMKKPSRDSCLTLMLPKSTIRRLSVAAAEGGYENAADFLGALIARAARSTKHGRRSAGDEMTARFAEILGLERFARSMTARAGGAVSSSAKNDRSTTARRRWRGAGDGPVKPISAARLRRIVGG